MPIGDLNEVFQDRDFRYAVVVDRLGTGLPVKMAEGDPLPNEFFFEGFPRVLGKETRLRGPEVIHLFRNNVLKIHTAEGEYVHRYGIKEAPEDLIAELGAEVTDCTPIEGANTATLERWNTEGLNLDPAKTLVKRERVTAGMRGRDGVAGTRAGWTG